MVMHLRSNISLVTKHYVKLCSYSCSTAKLLVFILKNLSQKLSSRTFLALSKRLITNTSYLFENVILME